MTLQEFPHLTTSAKKNPLEDSKLSSSKLDLTSFFHQSIRIPLPTPTHQMTQHDISSMILSVLPPRGSTPISHNLRVLNCWECRRKLSPRWTAGRPVAGSGSARLALISCSFLLICQVVSCVKHTLIRPDDPQAATAAAAVEGSASSATAEGGSAPF